MTSGTNGNGNGVIEITSPAEHDAEILQLRLSGVALRRIEKQYNLTEGQVLASLDRTLPLIDAATRARYLREAIGQLDQLQSWWTAEARHSAAACALLIKINERRCALLGLDAAQHSRMDPTRVVEEAGPDQGSTAQLIKELDRICAERSGGVLIEAEAEPPTEPAA
jgi:hypothetical protein